MRTTVIISKRGPGYVSTVSAGRSGGGHQGSRAGLVPYEAAATAARYMIEYAKSNPEGGDLMAPPEVMEHVPEHLRSIPATHQGLNNGSQQIELLTKPPAPGAKVGVVMHRQGQHWLDRKASVVSLRDHSPVDGASERDALAVLSDGTEVYWWNLTLLP